MQTILLSIQLIQGWRRALDLPIISLRIGKSFFFTFFVDKFLLCAILHATMNANFSACMVCAEQDSAPQRTEMDYGNKESYDKQDGE